MNVRVDERGEWRDMNYNILYDELYGRGDEFMRSKEHNIDDRQCVEIYGWQRAGDANASFTKN